MGYIINGEDKEADADGYLVEADFSNEAAEAIAAAEGVALSDEHWTIINYFRDKYREDGHTPSFRNFMKDMAELMPGVDSKGMYDLFPKDGPAKQAVRIAGLTKPFGKAGY
ncbi:MAG: TusE/DsrC/DsvC family sulfur relay protein [Rhodocyclaceae bacterium]|nr:TusE/DsrC/DsvC family sulfur relay protein [Rhodocyclaceae bacterium]